MFARRLPIELYDEITSYIWNDSSSLKACALANRVLVAPSQKRLFYRIALSQYKFHDADTLRACIGCESLGTPSSFYWLLAHSPHLAEYVQVLYIIDIDSSGRSIALDVELPDIPPVLGNERDLHFEDYKFMNGEEISDLDHTIRPYREIFKRWLPKDKFLPLFAPLLSDLKALHIVSTSNWQDLPYRVLFTLLYLMRLPSLVYLQLLPQYPLAIINMALGENVKHLALNSYPTNDQLPFRLALEHPPLRPVYLERFFACRAEFLDRFPPTSRIQISNLRKLVVAAIFADEHAHTQRILQKLRDTLEDFEFSPADDVVSRRPSEINIHQMEDPITLSGLTSLKRLAVSLMISNKGSDISTPIPWLCNLLRSGYSTSVTQHLEELSIRVSCPYATGPPEVVPVPWEPLFNALLEEELQNLRILKIFITHLSARTAMMVLDMLSGCDAVAKLRCRPGLVLNMRVCDHSFPFWETSDWTMCRSVNIS